MFIYTMRIKIHYLLWAIKRSDNDHQHKKAARFIAAFTYLN